jgi:Tol biopolymer transport system component
MREAFARQRLFLIIALATPLVFAGVAVLASSGGSETAATAPSATTMPRGHSRPDYVIDLHTGVITPLPEAILRSVAKSDEGSGVTRFSSLGYALSPDRSLLAYVGNGDEESHQIFVARIDGTAVRQMTHDPTGARSPAWSPDGTSIAYEGYGSGDVGNLFLLDVSTGRSRQITEGPGDLYGAGPQFTPDGSSLIYTGGAFNAPVLETVPVAGGNSTLLIGPGGGLADAGNGSLSPDGSRITFLASGAFKGGSFHCGPCRFVTNVNGTERRIIPPCVVNPAGTWSPDGSRIVCSDENGVTVVDIATGNASHVAEGSAAIWLDRHTLLVEV